MTARPHNLTGHLTGAYEICDECDGEGQGGDCPDTYWKCWKCGGQGYWWLLTITAQEIDEQIAEDGREGEI